VRSPELVALVAGLLAGGFAVCGVFFLKFWFRTRDSLFLAFAIAFWLMAVNQAAPPMLGAPRESIGGIYLIRLAAFVLIILAVLQKNVRDRRGRRSGDG
jgi:hypothetical protein